MICEFQNEYRFLSNFYPLQHPIQVESILYYTSENAFQAMKTLDKEARIQISKVNPYKAKKLGRKVILREDWEDIKLNIMEMVIYKKFRYTPLKELLLSTYPKKLIEGNGWNDTFWGVSNGVGSNNLGIILMKVRDHFMIHDYFPICSP
jgi:hypothetical protein